MTTNNTYIFESSKDDRFIFIQAISEQDARRQIDTIPREQIGDADKCFLSEILDQKISYLVMNGYIESKF